MTNDTSLTSPGSLTRAVRRGAGALARAQVAAQFVSIASLALLLRMLTPQDFGLVAMVVPLLLFLRIFTTLGLQFTTVQRKELTPSDISAAFWIQLAAGAIVTTVTLWVAPLVGSFYAKPEFSVTLRNLTMALAGTSLVAAIGMQPQALLERRLEMGKLWWTRFVAQLVGAGAAVAAAWQGAGVWALVVQQYVELFLLSGLCLLHSRWRPIWPPKWGDTARHVRFGGWFAATTLVLFAADNLDRVLVGRLVSAAAAGLYSQAYNLMMKPVYLVTTPLTALALASLSRAERNPGTAQAFVEGFQRALAIALLPCAMGLALVGDRVMLTLGGEEWREAGPLLAALSLGLFAQAVVILNGYMLMASGRGRACFFAAVGLAAALVVGYLIGWRIGRTLDRPTMGIAVGYTTTILLVGLGPHAWFCWSAGGYVPLRVLQTWLRPFSAAGAMAILVAGVGWVLPQSQPLLRMTLQIAVGISSYVWFARGELRWLAEQVRPRGRHTTFVAPR